jgi:hypothetical protein
MTARGWLSSHFNCTSTAFATVLVSLQLVTWLRTTTQRIYAKAL